MRHAWLAVVLIVCTTGEGTAQDLRDDLYVTNGQVNATAFTPSGTTLYIGGSFTRVSPPSGGGVPFGAVSGSPPATFPKVAGVVHAVAADGAGGWYIGGLFTAVGETPRSNAAHIDSDGDVSAWNPNVLGTVMDIEVAGSTVYLGGGFTSVGGQLRGRIAAVDATTGSVASWNPNANGQVNDLAVSGSTVYAGGVFTNIGGQSRNNIAALDAGTGAAKAWNPNANNQVHVVTRSGSVLYAGGNFTNIGGQARNYVAAIDTTSGSATAWNANPDFWVRDVKVEGSKVYLAGIFGLVGGQTRNRIAAVTAGTGAVMSWNPNAGIGVTNVLALAVSGSTVYAGGTYSSIGGQTRNCLAALDTLTGLATSWNPDPNGPVQALGVSGATVYAGGTFTGLGGVTRNRIAALDVKTGAPTSWNPNANNTVWSLAVIGSTVYAGGDFTTVGGGPGQALAGISTTTGLVTLNFLANGRVTHLVPSGSTLYAAGTFTSISGQSRTKLAALDGAGAVTSWNPNPAGGNVNALAVDGSTVYAGGTFTNIGGQPRNRIAALQTGGPGTATSWNPNANGDVTALAANGTTVYAGGAFSTIGGQSRSRIAALDAGTGNATAWNPGANNNPLDMALHGSTLYVAGQFDSIGGEDQHYLAALDASTGAVADWSLDLDSSVRAIEIGASALYAGGDFTAAGAIPKGYLAAAILEPGFADASEAPINSWAPLGAAWADYDRDSDLDVFLSIRGLGGQLLRNDHPSPFAGMTAPPLNGGASGRITESAWADYDNDGDLDLYLAQEPLGDANGECWLLRNDGQRPGYPVGDNYWVNVTTPMLEAYDAGLFPSETSRAVAWGDYNRDGRVDLVVTAWDGPCYLLRNDGGGAFADVTPGALSVADFWDAVAWVDYDGDGDDDLYVVRGNAETNVLFRNDAGTLLDATPAPLANALDDRGFAWGDYDNDGDLDVHMKGATGGRLLRNDGAGTFVDMTASPMEVATAVIDSDWGDLDNDGDLDLLVTRWEEPAIIYRNDGGGSFVVFWAPGNDGWMYTTGNWGDTEGDGDLDFYLTGLSGSQLFRNDRFDPNHWLHVRLDGTASNGAGIGARVRVVAGGTSQLREIMGGDSHGPLLAMFGLGSATSVDTLEVRWPSGRVTVQTGIGVDRLITQGEGIVLRVPSSYATIQAAIDAAIEGDSVLVAAGTYTGAGNRNLDFGGKDLVLAYDGMAAGPWNGWSPDSLAGQVIIDCQGSGRGMIFQTGETAASLVRGLSFVNGYDAVWGGGLLISAAPMFDRCIIAGNASDGAGGGMYVWIGGSPSFSRCTITGNHASASGGGIIADAGAGTVSFTQCIVWGNCAEADGGEVFKGGSPVISFTCCVVDTSGVYPLNPPTYVSGNVFTNPLFCEQTSCYMAPGIGGRYTLASDSPCLPANNACGQPMGALGQGCAIPVSVWLGEGDGTTWQDGANWSAGEPQAGDDVLIEDLPVTDEVVYDESALAGGLMALSDAQSVSIDSLTSEETLRILMGTLALEGTSTVDTLVLETGGTLGGADTVTANVLVWNGGLMTDTGTTRVLDAMTLATADVKSIRGGRQLESEGAWTWPGTGDLRHGDGALGTRIENASTGTLTVSGARTVDHEGTWGTAAAFENAGSAVQTAASPLTVEAVTTNQGTIEVQAGLVDLAGGLTNFSGTSLTGGTYDVTGTLRFPGADVQTNAATIVLDGAGSSILDATNANGLAQFSTNAAGGALTVTNGRNLTAPGSVLNAGILTVGAGSTFTATGTYTQTAGKTALQGGTSTLAATSAQMQGGSVTGSGSLSAPTMVSGLLAPAGLLNVNGNYVQTGTGELEIEIGGYTQGTEYDLLQVTGTAQLDGGLRVELVPPFDPIVNDAFEFLTADAVTGTFTSLEAFSIGSHVEYGDSSAVIVVDAKHPRFTGGPGGSWFNLANWTNGLLPGPLQDVLITTSVMIDGGGTAQAREVRVIGGSGHLSVLNGTIDCDTLRVRQGGIYTLNQSTSMSETKTLRLESGSQFQWGMGDVVIDGGWLEKEDGGFVVGDSPTMSLLELRNGAGAVLRGTVTVGAQAGDAGRIDVGAGSTLSVDGLQIGSAGSGAVVVRAGGGIATGALEVGPQGTLSGNGSVTGSVVNRGVMAPGDSVGVFAIVGDYTQLSGGVLEIQIEDSLTADRLDVAGQATLGGTLRVRESAGFPLDPGGLQFQVLNYATRSGMFAGILTAPGPGGIGWDDSLVVTPSYEANALVLALADRVGVEEAPVRALRVFQNFPNPFRSSTTIQFDLPDKALVSLKIFDVQGRLVRTLNEGAPMDAGRHQVSWDGRDDGGKGVSGGIYFYRLRTGQDTSVRRIVKLE